MRYTRNMDRKQHESLNLRNISPEIERLLATVGVTTRAQFERLGAEKAYLLLIESGHKPDPTLRHKLKGAEDDIDWHILAERERHLRRSRAIDIDEP